MARILIVDDDAMLCEMLSRHVQYMNHQADIALTLTDADAKLAAQTYDVVFLDVRMPDGNGLASLPKIRGIVNRPEVIIITGEGDPDGAALAIKNGAWDYIQKPSSIEKMTLPLIRALEYRKEKLARRPKQLDLKGIVGESPLLRESIHQLAMAASSDANVLISGETGTGKELFARAVHRNSSRGGNELVVLDCAAMTETLAESLLFGHKRGAFTGASESRAGLVKQAHRGTLFLDEVGEMPTSLQKKFLRVLQERRFRPVGGQNEMESDFRVIAATNRNLDEMVDAGQFRKDLLFRLRSLSLQLPPLRHRPEDILVLVRFHQSRYCDQYKVNTRDISPECLQALLAYRWPGNVRELVNTIETGVARAQGSPRLFTKHLPNRIRIQIAQKSIDKNESLSLFVNPAARVPDNAVAQTFKAFKAAALASAEKKYFQEILPQYASSVQEACAISGLGRSRLYDMIKKYKLSFHP